MDTIKEELTALYYYLKFNNPKNLIRQSIKDRIRFLQFAWVNKKDPYVTARDVARDKPVIYHITGQRFVSMSDAARYLGVPIGTIRRDISYKRYKYAVYPL